MANVLPYWPIKPFRQNPAHASWKIPKGARPEDYGLQSEPFEILTSDSVRLEGIYIPASKPVFPVAYATTQPEKTPSMPNKTLILLHGISSCKEFFLPTAETLAGQGINVVLFDLRAHGQSGGDYCTFGYCEKHDVSAVVDWLLTRDSTQKIGVMGHSLGGAIALQALADDKRLQFGVIESTFTSLETVVEQYGVNYFGFRSSWLAHYVLDRSAVIAKFDPYTVMPVRSAEKITQPVFVSHGDQDERIPWELGKENFDHIASVDKQWYLIPKAHHNGTWQAGGEKYVQALMAFVARQ